MKTIKELEEEIKGLNYGYGAQKRFDELKVKLQTLKDVLERINKRIDYAKEERKDVNERFPETRLSPRLDTIIEVLEELKKGIEGE